MSTPRLIELAKDGNPRAIAVLLNQQLQSRGITAVASRDGSCLRLLLEGQKQPNPSVLLPYLCKALTRLESPTLQRAEVYGRKQGDNQRWQAELKCEAGRFVRVEHPADRPAASRLDPLDPSVVHPAQDLAEAPKAISTAELRASLISAPVRSHKPRPGRQPGPISRTQSQPVASYSRVLPRGEAARQRRWERSHRNSSTNPSTNPQTPLVKAAHDADDSMDSLEAALMVGPATARRRASAPPVPSSSASKRKPSLYRPTDRPTDRSSDPLTAKASAQASAESPDASAFSVAEPNPTARSMPHPHRSSTAPRQGWMPFLSLWLQWQQAAWGSTLLLVLLAVPVMVLLLFGIFSLVNQFTDEQMMLVLGVCFLFILPLLGLLLGEAQTRVLRQRLYGIGGWRWITLLGVVLGFCIAVGSHFTIGSIFSPVIANPDPDFVVGRGLPFISSTLGVGFGFFFLGFLQWLMISTSVAGSYYWPLATGVGSMVSWVVGMAVSAAWLAPRILENVSPSSFWSVLSLGLTGGLISWLLFHAVSGVALAALLRNCPRIHSEENL